LEFDEKLNDIRLWYDGYRFGKKDIYNPWSILYYVDKLTTDADISPEAYWINTSSNSIIRELIHGANNETKAAIEKLMNGGEIETALNETVTYGDLTAKNENIWSFLLFTGYLKVESARHVNDENLYSLVIP
ncbi:MAG: AAA family ATPase, partial [bacterium]|nr:AAA family ATPase [bacterium]